jgi:hypothetical protein
MRSQLRLRVLLPVAVLALLGLGYGALAFTGTPAEEPAPKPLAAPAAAKDPERARLTRKEWRKQANLICAGVEVEIAKLGEPQTPAEVQQTLPNTLALADKALVDLKALVPPKRDQARVNKMLKYFGGFVKVETQAAAALVANDIAQFVDLNSLAFELNDKGNHIARELGAARCASGGRSDSVLARKLKRHRVVVAVLYTPDSAVDQLTVAEARAGAGDVNAGFVAIDVTTDTRSIALLASRYDVRDAPAVMVFARWQGAVNILKGYADRETIAQAAENAAL